MRTRVALGFSNRIAVLLVHKLEEKKKRRFSELSSIPNTPCHSDSEVKQLSLLIRKV